MREGGHVKGSLVEMSDRRRELIFRVMDEQPSLLPILHYFTKWRRCDEMLVWCLENNLTGKNLLEWTHKHWGNSLLSMVKFILMKLNKERTPMPVFLGTDLLS